MSVVDNTPRGKATGVSPWYGVYRCKIVGRKGFKSDLRSLDRGMIRALPKELQYPVRLQGEFIYLDSELRKRIDQGVGNGRWWGNSASLAQAFHPQGVER